MFETGKAPAAIVEEQGPAAGHRHRRDRGGDRHGAWPRNADKVAEYRSGKDKLFGFFVGQVMKATGGKANPAMVNELLKKKLG